MLNQTQIDVIKNNIPAFDICPPESAWSCPFNWSFKFVNLSDTLKDQLHSWLQLTYVFYLKNKYPVNIFWTYNNVNYDIHWYNPNTLTPEKRKALEEDLLMVAEQIEKTLWIQCLPIFPV